MPKQLWAFTAKATGLARQLSTDVHVSQPSVKSGESIRAIWDTGATSCAISKATVDKLGLVPTGFCTVQTANGSALKNTYTIDIRLPNGVTIQKIVASEVDELSGGCDALIGMDVICLGDFSITNHQGNTCMSFRVPSAHEIDYVKNLNYGLTPIKHPPAGKKGSNITPPKKKRRK